MCIISLQMKAIWERHKFFKFLYFLKISDVHFIAKIIKPPYYDKWRVWILDDKREEEFDTKQEAMIFAENNIDPHRIPELTRLGECKCYLER